MRQPPRCPVKEASHSASPLLGTPTNSVEMSPVAKIEERLAELEATDSKYRINRREKGRYRENKQQEESPSPWL